MTELPVGMLGWWAVIALLASWLSAGAYPLVRYAIRGASPAVRSLVRLAYVWVAPLAATLAVAINSLPGLSAWLVSAHCHGGHCGGHAPVYSVESTALAGLSAAGGLAVGTLLFTLVWGLRRARRRLRALHVVARGTPQGYRLLASSQAIACCTGVWRPRVLLSSGLVDCLRADELQVVLAHEHAHARRLDNLRALLLGWATVAWPAPLARRARADAAADAEQACDLAAVRTGFSLQQVAATIARLSGLTRAPWSAARGAAGACDEIPQRLAALRDGGAIDAVQGWFAGALCLAVGCSLQVYLLTESYHGLIEWLGGKTG